MTKKIIKNISAPGLLHRILEEPTYVALIQNLDAPILSKLIDHIGLEDSGEIIALATTDQLKKVFDEDLWKNDQPGQEEKFDPIRFGIWLEILLEMGSHFAVQKLIDMNEDFLTLAFSSQVWVLDLEEIALSFSQRRNRSFSEEDLIEKALESSLSSEIDKYAIISKNYYSWDAVLNILLALDSDHHEFLIRFLERCAYFSSEKIEDAGGLYEVLTAEEQIESDVAYEREKRREQIGYVSPLTAKSFLKLARGPVTTPDFITPAYFRDYKGPTLEKKMTSPTPLDLLLIEAKILSSPQNTPQLEHQNWHEMRTLLKKLQDKDETLFLRRMEELSYLANILISGCSFQGRAFRPSEATEAVLNSCYLGLEQMRASSSQSTFIQILVERSGVEIFRVGWNFLFHKVCLPSAQLLLTQIENLDPKVARLLREAISEEAPWQVREELGILEASMDPSPLRYFEFLIDECPTELGKFFTHLEQVHKVQEHLKNLLSLL